MIREETIELREFVVENDLSRPRYFNWLSIGDLAASWNGIGADWFPKWLRRVFTTVLHRLRPLAFVHDVEFAYAPRTYWAFTTANARWAYNALLMVIRDPLMLFAIRFLICAWICALACQLGGWKGFKSERQGRQ